MITVLQNRDNVTLSLLSLSLFPFSLPCCSKTLNITLRKSGVSLNLSFLLLLFFPIEFNVVLSAIAFIMLMYVLYIYVHPGFYHEVMLS